MSKKKNFTRRQLAWTVYFLIFGWEDHPYKGSLFLLLKTVPRKELEDFICLVGQGTRAGDVCDQLCEYAEIVTKYARPEPVTAGE